MKILMVTNMVRTYALGFQNSINPLKSLGHEIVWAADFSKFNGDLSEIPCKTYQISINTSPFNPCNIKALRQIFHIIKAEKIEGVVCSTPIGGFLARIAAKIRGVKPVIYAAHGFLFFKGAPLINRTVYKWEEVLLAHWTDVLITITDEDFEAAQKFKLRSGVKPYLVHGAGVKTGVTVKKSREEKRKELGIPADAFVIVSAGEIVKSKNNYVIIKALAELKNPNIHYLCCGDGNKMETWISLSQKVELSNNVHFLGYRTDVSEIMNCSDIFAMPSFVEGVPRSLLEAMDLGLACIGSDTRGVSDLIGKNSEGGFLNKWQDSHGFAQSIQILKDDFEVRKKMGLRNKETVKRYSAELVSKELYCIYETHLKFQGDLK